MDEIEEDSVIVQYAGILAMHGVAFASDAPYSKWQRRPDTKEAAYKVRARARVPFGVCVGVCDAIVGLWLTRLGDRAQPRAAAVLRAHTHGRCTRVRTSRTHARSLPLAFTTCRVARARVAGGVRVCSQVHKKVLQILGCKWPQPVQWLLKAPTIHSVFLEELLKVYPDACIVVTHRRPVEVLPSWTKFVLSPMVATLWRHGTKCGRRARRAAPCLRVSGSVGCLGPCL